MNRFEPPGQSTVIAPPGEPSLVIIRTVTEGHERLALYLQTRN